jgi:hypothetical protein
MSIEAMRQALEALETLARYENPETRIQVRKPKEGGPIVTMYPHKVAFDAAADLRAAIEQAEKPVAWREFDGEGGYDYRTYDDNENFRDEYIKRNGEKYADWVDPLYTAPPQQEKQEPRKLWLWKNFVEGRPEYWAFDNPFPCVSVRGDPLTLGEPCGWALLKSSVNGRPDRSEQEVINTVTRLAAPQYDQTSLELCKECGWKALTPGDGCLVCARQKAKPVAWMFDFLADDLDEIIRDWTTQEYAEIEREKGFNVRPLYAAPRKWVELTDDEARALVNRATFGDRTNWQALVYMVDAKLKEKNA